MKVINKKGMIFEKVSVVDLLIIMVVGFALFFGYNFFNKDEMIISSESQFYYTFEASKVAEGFENNIEIGGSVYNSSKNYYVGEVVEVTSMPYIEWTMDIENGKFIKQEVPGESTVLIKIKASGQVTESAYYAGQELIKVGSVFPIKGLGFASNGVVIRIEEDLNEGN